MKIILIHGKSQSGKDTVAKFLYDKLTKEDKRVLKISNAYSVKYIAEKCFGWDGEKDERGKKLLIDITHAGYNYHKYFWEYRVYLVVKPVMKSLDYLIIPDWRYRNTYEFWKDRVEEVYTVKVERPNLKYRYSNFIEKDDTKELRNFNFDVEIINSGSLEELEEKVEEMISMMRW